MMQILSFIGLGCVLSSLIVFVIALLKYVKEKKSANNQKENKK